jgi:nuclear pore complex protein Nup98-Nup96
MFGGTNGPSAPGTTSAFGAFGNSNTAPNSFGGGTSLFASGSKPASGFGAGGTNGATSSHGGGLFGGNNGSNVTNNTFNSNAGSTFGGALNNPGLGPNIGDPPGTSVVPFQAYTEKENNGTTNAFQNITFQDAYKKWSQDELRLTDYAQGRRHGNANGAGAFGVNSGFGSGGFNASNTTSGGFGTAAAAPVNSLFGNANNSTSAFGQSNSNSFGGTTSNSLFGAKPAATAGFGGQSTISGQSNTAGGLFGNAVGGFGATSGTANSTNAFGNGSNGGGLFGSAGNLSKVPSAFGGGTFSSGATNTTSYTNPTPSSTFGATSGAGTSNNNSNGPFGSNQTANPNLSATGGLFGSMQQNTAQAFGTGSGFGGQSQTQNANGMPFGAATQKSTGGIFGNTTSGITNGLFGNASAPNVPSFGPSTTVQASSGGLFGAAKSATPGTTLFGNPVSTLGTGVASTNNMFGPAPTVNTSSQPQASSAPGFFGASSVPSNPPKPTLFGSSVPSSSLAHAGNSAQPSGIAFGGTTNHQQPSILGGPASVAIMPQNAPNSASQGLTTSLTDLSAYSSSLFANMGAPTSLSSGPVATPLSKPSARRSSVLPMYKLNPASSLRMMTPQKRGFGLSSYSIPPSNLHDTNPSSGGLHRSILGAGVGRTLGRSGVSSGTLRRSFNTDETIIAPGAFSSPNAIRLHNATNVGGRRLVINREMRSDLFTSSNRLPEEPGPSRKLSKHVSFEADGGSPSPVALIEHGTMVADGTPIVSAADSQASVNIEQDHEHCLDLIDEHREDDSTPIKSGTTPVSFEVGPWEMSPSWNDICKMAPAQRASVPNFCIGRPNAATISFKSPVDLTGLSREDLCGNIVKLKPREASVYPAGTQKPPRGQGLNVPAQIVIHQAWPRHPDNRGLDEISVKEHIRKLSRVANTTFESYDKDTGVWTFTVPHFTTYGVDSGSDATDDEDDEDFAIKESLRTSSSDLADRAGDEFALRGHLGDTLDVSGMVHHAASEGLAQDQHGLADSTVHHRYTQRGINPAEPRRIGATSSSGILRARMRALREATAASDFHVMEGDDWVATLRNSLSPAKADRHALRAVQDQAGKEAPRVDDLTQSLGRTTGITGEERDASRNYDRRLGPVALDDNDGFSSSIDLMRSLFDNRATAVSFNPSVPSQPMKPKVGMHVKVCLHPRISLNRSS